MSRIAIEGPSSGNWIPENHAIRKEIIRRARILRQRRRRTEMERVASITPQRLAIEKWINSWFWPKHRALRYQEIPQLREQIVLARLLDILAEAEEAIGAGRAT